MKNVLIGLLLLVGMACTSSQTLSTEKLNEEILYHPKDGVIRIYGAGGPQTAIQRVAAIYQQETNQKVEVFFGPESKWTKQAKQDADIIWGTAEQGMTAFLENYSAFNSADVVPIYIRPAVIAVKKGNPKNIQSIEDLFEPNRKIVVVEGAGVYNTSGTGVWEDIVARKGNLDDVIRFRKNIIAYAKGSGAGFRAFKKADTDAWITWGYWVLNHPEEADLVTISQERAIYRDLSVVTNSLADSEAKQFIEFLQSDKGKEIFKSEGWTW